MWPLLALACSSPETPTDSAETCAGSLSPGAVEVVAEGFATGTEGVAFSSGRLFVSVGDGVVEIDHDGGISVLANTSHALGLAPTSSGILLADPGEFTLDGSGEDGRVLQVAFNGTLTELAAGLPNPNFVAATPWGTILISDDTLETLWEIGPEGTHEWATGIPSPNGMGFSPDGATLYVVSTFTPDPPLWRIPIEGEAAGTAESIVTFPSGSAPDGLVVDADGRVLVALNLGGAITVVDPSTGEAEELVSGLSTPASLAFGEGGGWDPCAVYATSLYADTVQRIGVGSTGAALFQ